MTTPPPLLGTTTRQEPHKQRNTRTSIPAKSNLITTTIITLDLSNNNKSSKVLTVLKTTMS